ncbi:MAG: type 1 glutamine amidotransferase [Streptosporangiaceae bacterium]
MDPRVLVIEQVAVAGIGTLGPLLQQAGITLEICQAHADEPVPGEVGCDGLVVLGGPMGACDDDQAPWLPATRALLRRAVGSGTPVLGVCLGAQLLTVACGGQVEPGAAGPEIGVTPVMIDAPDDPLLQGLPRPAAFVQWHHDVTVRLPPGAVSLAHSAAYPHQVYRIGNRAWGVGFHPEATLDSLTSWAELTGLPGDQADEVIRDARNQQRQLTEAARIIAANFAGIIHQDRS